MNTMNISKGIAKAIIIGGLAVLSISEVSAMHKRMRPIGISSVVKQLVKSKSPAVSKYSTFGPKKKWTIRSPRAKRIAIGAGLAGLGAASYYIQKSKSAYFNALSYASHLSSQLEMAATQEQKQAILDKELINTVKSTVNSTEKKENQLRKLEIILKKGANPNYVKRTIHKSWLTDEVTLCLKPILCMALIHAPEAAIKLLLEYGADPLLHARVFDYSGFSPRSPHHTTPLSLSIEYRSNVVHILLDHINHMSARQFEEFRNSAQACDDRSIAPYNLGKALDEWKEKHPMLQEKKEKD